MAHMGKIELAGKRFGRLRVMSFAGMGESITHREARWNCLCDCGNSTIVLSSHLRSGRIVSCRCFQKEQTAKAGRKRIKHGHASGGKPTPIYSIWIGMHVRCYHFGPAWRYYGARGIQVCARWFKFENFLADMGERPEGKTIDRINSDLHYMPSNCRWATRREQQNNRRINHRIVVGGISHTVAEWARIKGIRPSVIHRRIYTGWTETSAVTTPLLW